MKIVSESDLEIFSFLNYIYRELSVLCFLDNETQVKLSIFLYQNVVFEGHMMEIIFLSCNLFILKGHVYFSL